MLCAELSGTNCRAELSAPNCPAPNCPRRIVLRRIVRAEMSCAKLSAPNCPAPNCPRRIVHAELSCAELSAPNCPAPNCPDTVLTRSSLLTGKPSVSWRSLKTALRSGSLALKALLIGWCALYGALYQCIDMHYTVRLRKSDCALELQIYTEKCTDSSFLLPSRSQKCNEDQCDQN